MRKDFWKGYLLNFINELFIIFKTLTTESITYRLKDMNGEEIKGSFYVQELSKYSSDIYTIEKILMSSKEKFLVKWRVYDEPSWITATELDVSSE